MNHDPASTSPNLSFADVKRAEHVPPEPAALATNSFRLALFNQGTQLGWLGQNGSGWATLVSDAQQALVLEQYPYEGVAYFRIKGSGSYMSVSANSYIGFYNWLGATGFALKDGHLVSDFNQQKLSLYSTDNGYLYAWDAYTVLEVRQEAVAPVPANPPLGAGIEHVVVLMLENRSFDNMLGGLYPTLSASGQYHGLTGTERIPVDPRDPSGPSVQVFSGGDDQSNLIRPYPDPGELFDDMTQQLYGQVPPGPNVIPAMNGFAWNYGQQPAAPLSAGGPLAEPDPRNIMQYYEQSVVPMTSYLGLNYAVCDSWFAAGPVQTLANRIFAHCGTPGMIPGTNLSRVNNPDFVKNMSITPPLEPPVKDKTIFQLLDETYPGQINWKVYYHDAPISALCEYVYNRWDWTSWDGGNVYTFNQRLSDETNLEYDIRHDRLPKYSFIEPRYTDFFADGPVNSSHPGGAGIDFSDPNGSSLPPPISVRDGEHLLSQVYGILAKYPDTFRKTLLVVLYDEHGGLYDHMPPPNVESPFAAPVDNFKYDRNGVRVPALLINPAIPPGTIYPPRPSDPKKPLASFDHTSLISTVCAQFGLQGPPLTPRVGKALTLAGLIPPNAVDHVRPPPPVVQPSASSVAGPLLASPAKLSVAAATWQTRTPHDLPSTLLPLLSASQQRRILPGS
jgi:phospholipase C